MSLSSNSCSWASSIYVNARMPMPKAATIYDAIECCRIGLRSSFQRTGMPLTRRMAAFEDFLDFWFDVFGDETVASPQACFRATLRTLKIDSRITPLVIASIIREWITEKTFKVKFVLRKTELPGLNICSVLSPKLMNGFGKKSQCIGDLVNR